MDTRKNIDRLFAKHPEKSWSSAELGERFGLTSAAIWRHLNAMVQEGLVTTEGTKSGRRYRLLNGSKHVPVHVDAEMVEVTPPRLSQMRFTPAPFLVLKDPQGELWLAEKLEGRR